MVQEVNSGERNQMYFRYISHVDSFAVHEGWWNMQRKVEKMYQDRINFLECKVKISWFPIELYFKTLNDRRDL